MRKFIYKILAFILLTILAFSLILLFLPATPYASKSLLFATLRKDSLLVNAPSPRIIFVGGSNLSFGLNSQEIKDSLHINPINTAINVALGLKYMLENTLQYVKKGDIVVLVPEYDHFFSDWDRYYEELFRIVFDVDKSKICLLSFNFDQLRHHVKYANKVISSRLHANEYLSLWESDIYSVNSFNKYGDVDAHWNLENIHNEFEPKAIDVTTYNPDVMAEIKYISNKFQEKGCIFLISYPCFQESSFNNSKEAIRKVEQEYYTNEFIILGSPERYMMPDSLMFDFVYHINKQGVDRRTKFLIEDLKIVINDSLGILK